MSIKLSKNTIIYFPLVPNVSTGGPEAIHRLAYFLKNELSLNVKIFYFPQNDKFPVHDEYIKYDNEFTEKIIDKEENILILPDFVKHLVLQNDYRKIQKCVWWLSVDFFYIGIYEYLLGRFRFKLINNKVSFINLINYYFPFIRHTDLANECLSNLKNLNLNKLQLLTDVKLNFCQSHYSYLWLDGQKFKNKVMLTDFFDKDILDIKCDKLPKENIVVYNPSKGYSFTRHLINRYSDIKFVPIINLKKAEVIELLKKAKIYIDFGNHPGRDRLPREAALCGCCVITSKRGSANFYEDLPIPDRYKFDDHHKNISSIYNVITEIFQDFDQKYHDFQDYRLYCNKINHIAISQIKNIFSANSSIND
jgi:hypothetical protein